MKEEQDDFSRYSAKPFSGSSNSDNPPEDSLFNSFDDGDSEFEESDRDTDFSIGFREEVIEDEDILDEEEPLLTDHSFDELLPDELEEDQTALFDEQDTFLKKEAEKIAAAEDADPQELWESSPAENDIDRDEPWEEEASNETSTSQAFWETPVTAIEDPVDDLEQPINALDEPISAYEADDDLTDEAEPEEDSYMERKPRILWAAEEEPSSEMDQSWMTQDEYAEDTMESERWPLSMLAVGTLAILLVIAGVYGVMQQRSATQEEIMQLQASLATAVSPEEVAISRAALQDANAKSARLAASVDSLRLENQRLSDMVTGLEAQLAPQETKPAAVAAPKPAPKPVAEPAPPAVQQASTLTGSTSGGNWFVNFGSYGQESAAQNWAQKLKPLSGEVIVAPTTSNGRTYYRVRVINLSGESTARKTAEDLQSKHGVSKLWVGKQ